MRSRVDAQLRREAESFGLRFRCGECLYFAAETRSCSEGFPNEEHCEIDLTTVETVSFCKRFELD